MRADTQITGNIGLYYCCYQLSLLGWNVMPTARNAKGVDIIAYNQDASKAITIQVKALSKRVDVPLGSSLDKVMGDYWVVVSQAASSSPSASILLPNEVRAGAVRNEKEGRVSFWLPVKAYEQPEMLGNWSRIGAG